MGASQQMTGFDPSLLDIKNEDSEDDEDAYSVHSMHVNEEVEHMEVYNQMKQLKEEIKELSEKEPIAVNNAEPVTSSGLMTVTNEEQKRWMDEIDKLREQLAIATKDKLKVQRQSQMDMTEMIEKMKILEAEDQSESDIDDNESVHSVHVNEEVEHTETYNEIKKMREEIMIKDAQIDSLKSEVDDLSQKHRKHKRRESEVFDQIGDNAKDIVAQLEELDEAKKKKDDAELTLAYLKAEKQRTDIALQHAKENVTRYRQEANAMKKKIKELETHRPRPSAFNSLQSKVVNLEKKVEDNANMELQVSFLKAEKQRMEVNLEFQI